MTLWYRRTPRAISLQRRAWTVSRACGRAENARPMSRSQLKMLKFGLQSLCLIQFSSMLPVLFFPVEHQYRPTRTNVSYDACIIHFRFPSFCSGPAFDMHEPTGVAAETYRIDVVASFIPDQKSGNPAYNCAFQGEYTGIQLQRMRDIPKSRLLTVHDYQDQTSMLPLD